MASPATVPHPPSLLSTDDSNSYDDSALSDCEGPNSEAEVRNQPLQVWPRVLAALKKRREQQQFERHLQKQVQSEAMAKANQQVIAQKMQNYLQSEDPILIKEALNWLMQQKTYPPWSLPLIKCMGASVQNERSEALVEAFQALLLRWGGHGLGIDGR